MRCRTILAFGLFIRVCAGQNLLPSAPTSPTSFTWQERWDHYLYRTYSWQRMSLLAADVGIDMTLSKPRCGRTTGCFGDRYAGAFFRRSTRTTIELIAGEALDEDMRRRPSGKSGLGPRLGYALAHSFTAYHADGHSRFSYGRMIGAVGGIAAFQAWDQRPITMGRMGHALSWSFASNVQDSLLTEFGPDMKRFGLKLKNRFIPSKN